MIIIIKVILLLLVLLLTIIIIIIIIIIITTTIMAMICNGNRRVEYNSGSSWASDLILRVRLPQKCMTRSPITN